MVKAAPEAIARQITHLSRAAASFRQLAKQDALCAKADHLRSASNTVVSLLSDDMVAEALDPQAQYVPAELGTALSELKQAFEDISSSYAEPPRQEWRDYIAWNNLRSFYSALEL